MTHVTTDQDLDDGWVNIHRYVVFQQGILTVHSIIHNYLVTEVVWE